MTPYLDVYMKVMSLPGQGGIRRSVDITGKQACETPIHSLRGRLATLLRIPAT